ncbi:MAG: hypothetical protein H9533_09795 [Rhodobacteraceae bacterium]|nr:hypothetical protein [Paracoccaceae bacterium]
MRVLPRPFGRAVRSAFRREAADLILRLAAVLVGVAGTGLLAAAALIGLARLVGPILAPALIGAALLLLAILLWVASRRKGPQPQPAAMADTGTITRDEAAFTVGFVLGRVLLRQLTRHRAGQEGASGRGQ